MTAAFTLPQTGTWSIDPAHTEVTFSARHLMAAKVRGSFKTFSGTIDITDTPETSSVEVTIDALSIDTGVEDRDDHGAQKQGHAREHPAEHRFQEGVRRASLGPQHGQVGEQRVRRGQSAPDERRAPAVGIQRGAQRRPEEQQRAAHEGDDDRGVSPEAHGLRPATSLEKFLNATSNPNAVPPVITLRFIRFPLMRVSPRCVSAIPFPSAGTAPQALFDTAAGGPGDAASLSCCSSPVLSDAAKNFGRRIEKSDGTRKTAPIMFTTMRIDRS